MFKFKRTDIRDSAPWIIEHKTGARLGIEITGELAEFVARINARPNQAISPFLILDERHHLHRDQITHLKIAASLHFASKRGLWSSSYTEPAEFPIQICLEEAIHDGYIEAQCWRLDIGEGM